MNELRGNHALLLARGPMWRGDTDVERQVFILTQYAAKHDIIVMGVVRLPSSVANGPRAAASFAEIIDRKRNLNDYDLLLVTNLSRISRHASPGSRTALARFEDAGINIVPMNG